MLESKPWPHLLFPNWTPCLYPLILMVHSQHCGQRGPWTQMSGSCCSLQSILMASYFIQKKSQMPSAVYKVLRDPQSPPQPQKLSSCSLTSWLSTASSLFPATLTSLELSRQLSLLCLSGSPPEDPDPLHPSCSSLLYLAPSGKNILSTQLQ